MEFNFEIKCECGVNKKIDVIPNSTDNLLCIINSIEQNSDGLFYCLQNYHNGFDLVCVSCGGEQRINY